MGGWGHSYQVKNLPKTVYSTHWHTGLGWSVKTKPYNKKMITSGKPYLYVVSFHESSTDYLPNLITSTSLTHLLTLHPQLVTFMDYHAMHRFSLENQDQDTGSADTVSADLFWLW